MLLIDSRQTAYRTHCVQLHSGQTRIPVLPDEDFDARISLAQIGDVGGPQAQVFRIGDEIIVRIPTGRTYDGTTCYTVHRRGK